jgi:hypothetical protein
MWCRNYILSFEGARIATLATLSDLRMPECRDGRYRNGIFIDTRTQDNLDVRIVILPEEHPGEGTRVGVRVGGFGTHRNVCEHLLDEIARHLDVGQHYLDVVPKLHDSLQRAGAAASLPRAEMPQESRSSAVSLPPQPLPVEQKQ